MSTQVTPAKRPNDQNLAELNGRRKWLKSSSTVGSSDNVLLSGPSSKVIRVLFPASKIGGIIGKGGSTIAQIRQETGARVRVEESVVGCDERVIIIAGLDKESEILNKQVRNEGKGTKSPDMGGKPEEHGEADEKKLSVPAEDDSQLEKEKDSSSLQKALLVVFDKMLGILLEKYEGDEGSQKPSSATVRLLVFSGQVGCLLGKAGSVIKQMSAESGAQIRILPKDKLPSCASPSDELVQISGKHDAIRKSLQSISQQLLEHSLRHQDSFSAHLNMGPSSHSFGPPPRQDRQPPSNQPSHGHGAPFPAGFHDGEAGPVNFPPEVLTFRLLCSEEKVGSVIGKGGSIIKGLQNETRCDIKVLDGEGGSEDRIVIISGPAFPDEGISAPQDAMLRVQSRIFRASPENKDKNLTAKLLVASHQIGCLLGKGGSVIAEMRKSTGAYIRILGKDQVPKGAADNEEVVQVNGELEIVQEAIMQITSRLKNHFFRDVFPAFGHPPNPAIMDQMPPPPFPPYLGRREFLSSEAFSNQGLPFNKFDGPGGPPPHGGFHPHDDRLPFGQHFPRPGVPHMAERSSAPWGPQVVGHMGISDYPGAPQRRIGGFTGRNQPAVITNTKVEVVVPRFVVPAIYGEDGGCLRRIREISEAEITITDAKPGATETMIRISGTPEQTNAAQSLIQAFVIIETEAS